MYNPADMSEDLRNENWCPVLKSMDENEAGNKMKNIILEIFDKHAPRII